MDIKLVEIQKHLLDVGVFIDSISFIHYFSLLIDCTASIALFDGSVIVQ